MTVSWKGSDGTIQRSGPRSVGGAFTCSRASGHRHRVEIEASANSSTTPETVEMGEALAAAA